jgi:hypothetical protein
MDGFQKRKDANLAEVARSAFCSFALLALRHILDATVLKEGLHLDFAAAGAIKVMRRAGCTRVLAYLSHGVLLVKSVNPWSPLYDYINTMVELNVFGTSDVHRHALALKYRGFHPSVNQLVCCLCRPG